MLLELYSNEAHYPIIKKWWEGHGVTVLPESWLTCLGVIAVDADGTATAAAWLEMSNANGKCWLCYPVSNPDATPFQVFRALHEVADFLEAEAKRNDYRLMHIASSHPGLIDFFRARGAVDVDHNVTMLHKAL